jgi:hypothetical protein
MLEESVFRICLIIPVYIKMYTIKMEYNAHHRDPKVVAVVGRWSLFKGVR